MTRSAETRIALVALAWLAIGLFAAVPAMAQDNADTAQTSVTAVQSPFTSDGTAAPALASQSPQPAEKRRLVLMPSFNSFSPSDSKTRDRFGSSWPSIGLALAYKTQDVNPRRIEFRLDGIAQRSDTTSAFIFPVGLGINKVLSSSKSFSSYTGLTANLYIAKLESTPDGVDTGWQFKAGAGAIFGANVGQKLNVQASYYLIPELGGFKLSGFNVSAHLQLLTF